MARCTVSMYYGWRRVRAQSRRRGREAAQEEDEADIAQTWIPVLIFLPLRLGLDDRINPQYAPALKALLEMQQCVGIIGGKPRSAHYFIGITSANRLLYLDPHTVQPALRSSGYQAGTPSPDVSTAHLSGPSLPSMPLLDLDPSLAVGFLMHELSVV